MVKLEVIDLTPAQARELHRFTKRARRMYEDRQGGEAVSRPVGKIEKRADELRGEGGEIALSFGMRGENREAVVGVLRRELDMEERKAAQDWGISGNKLRAARNAVDKLENPDEVPRDE